MRKVLFLFLSTLLVTLTSCSQKKESKETSSNTTPSEKAVVLYFSKPEMTGVDTVSGASRVATENGEVIGNVAQLATWISDETKSPLVKIETTDAYPDDHKVLVDQATTERSSDFRPELKPLAIDLADYDTVYVGYPIWWADLPMAMYSFFEENDLSNKTVIPFSSHGGSDLAGTIDTIVELNPNATVETKHTLSISRDDITDSKKSVTDWVNSF